ncbi:Sodium/calcium exchanger membrane region [Trinorchestia longiramus]|nr:Sodium/calcium exchanger membrane region [Trinorchestia longiramus]
MSRMQTVTIPILEEDSYEKNVVFYVDIGEPQSLGGFGFEPKENDEMTEDEKIALLGKPKLGNNTRAQIRVKENKEYKNMVDKLVKKANASLLVGSSSWAEQFKEAFSVEAGGDDEEGEEGEEAPEKLPTCGDYVMHFITVFWKIVFALIPPTEFYGGYPTFVISIVAIGLVTALIGDIASHVGCCIGLKDSITAIGIVALGTSVPDRQRGWSCFVVSVMCIGLCTAVLGDLASHFGCTVALKDSVTAISIVALGTSIPDTFASKVAAQQDPYADASVGNVTGSNAVNVFLGIGIAWTVAAIYHNVQGNEFKVLPGNLAFSVTLFCVEAATAIALMMLRRNPKIGGELGGPRIPKILTSSFLFFLWVFYVFMSTLEAYGFIPSMTS